MRLTTYTPTACGETDIQDYDVWVHAAGSEVLKPNTAGSACKRRLRSSSDTVRKFPGGMTPRSFQLLTAGCPTPIKAATAAVPPRASTMASTELSIPLHSSRSVNLSSLHDLWVDNSRNVSFNNGMDGPRIIGRRLDLLLKALNALHGLSAEEISGLTGSSPNAFSQYRKGYSMKSDGTKEDRPLQVEVAIELCRRYPIDLDYFFRGEFDKVDPVLQLKMKEIELAEAQGKIYKPVRRPRERVKSRRRATS